MKCIGKFVLSIIVRRGGKEDRTRLQVRLFRSSSLSLALLFAEVDRSLRVAVLVDVVHRLFLFFSLSRRSHLYANK